MTGVGFCAEAARRQAFGARFDPLARDPDTMAALLERRLVLVPHAAWELPEEPTWREDPFGDGNWQFQYHTLRWLDPLRRVAAAGDPSGMPTWEKYARSWVQANPAAAGRQPPGWTDMAVGLRAQVFCFALPYLESPSWLVDAVRRHGEWLALPENLGRSNHALHQHIGLLVVGDVLQEPAWTELARARLSEHLLTCFDDEGANDEGSALYAMLNIGWWQTALRRVELAGLPAPEGTARVLDLAPRFVAHATEPDGRLTMIGDSVPAAVQALGHPATTFVATGGKEGAAPPELFRTYRRGYAFGRSAWPDPADPVSAGRQTYYSVRFGPQQTYHGRPDGGSFTYTSDGVRWVTGTGKFSYDARSPMRAYVRSRAGQNAITVRGVPYDVNTTVQLLRETHDEHFDTYLFEDEGYAGVRIRRLVCYSRSGEWLLVKDVVRAEEEVEVEAHLHLGVGVAAHVSRRQVDLSAKAVLPEHGEAEERTATLLLGGSVPAVSVHEGSDDPLAGWVSEEWNVRSAAPELVLAKRGRLTGFLYVITPVAVPGTDGLRMLSGSTKTEQRLAIPGRSGLVPVVLEAERIRLDERDPAAQGPAAGPEPTAAHEPTAANAPEQAPEPLAATASAAPPRTRIPFQVYDLDLLRQLQEEYRDRPMYSGARSLDPVTLTDQAHSRAAGLERMFPIRGCRVLEVGCARGHLLRVLQEEYDCEVVGTDVTSYPEWDQLPDIPLHVHDIATLDNDFLGTFDRIISYAVWEHVVHPFAALKATRQLLRPNGLMYLNANLYRGPKASHRYRELYFPWPHLLFQDEVIGRYYAEDLGRKPSRSSWVNKLTTAHYLTYFDLLDFHVQDLSWSMTPIDEPFYQRFNDLLGRYPRFDLERDFIRAIVTPGKRDPAAEATRRAIDLERRVEILAAENLELRRRLAQLSEPASAYPDQ